MTTPTNYESPSEEFACFLEGIAEGLSQWSQFGAYLPKLRLLATQFRQPFNLAVVGRMKTGKSTLINALIGQPLALSNVEEATATVNWICHGEAGETFQFLVHKRNGSTQSLPLHRIQEFAGKEDSNLARVREVAYLQFFADVESLKKVQIVDTPGTGSAVEEHESVATAFLDPGKIKESIAEGNKADAIVYVIPPVGRESDIDSLEIFSQARVSGAGPYNSVCVLHKWDSLEEIDPATNARLKAQKLSQQLKDMVITVIPVSGPLALAAKHAPDSYFSGLIEQLTNVGSEEFEKIIRTSRRWDADEGRLRARNAYENVPWASFVLLCRLIKSQVPESVKEARRIVRIYSGIDDLEQLLEAKFFSRLSIIKGLSVLQRAAILVEPLIREMQKLLGEFRESLSILTNDLKGTPSGMAWLVKERQKISDESSLLQRLLLDIDRSWLVQKEKLELLSKDLSTLEEIEARSDRFSPDERKIIANLCDYLANLNQSADTKRGLLSPIDHIGTLIDKYRTAENRTRGKERDIYSHLVTRLEQAANLHN